MAAPARSNVTEWGAFAGFSGVVVLLLLLLARASQSVLSESESTEQPPDAPDGPPVGPMPAEETGAGGRTIPAEETLRSQPSFGTGELLANVLVTHGLFAGLIAAGAVFWEVPASALGAGVPAPGALAWGVAAGVALYAANEAGAAAAARVGIDHEERLRELLAPESSVGWVSLLCFVLPVVAVAEELIFRGVLVGALAAGFALPPWGLAVASSAAFAVGHGAQGRGGVLVTGLLGFALAAAFVLSGSLALVIVAHYVVNALEFAVHEGLDVEWVG